MKKTLFTAFAASTLLFSSCISDDNSGNAEMADLTLNIKGLEDLGSDFVYEGWIIVDGAPVSTGTFSSTKTGQKFSVNAMQLEKATKFVLSIEPAGETGSAAATPSNTKLLAADFSGNTAPVKTDILGDFTNATGKFFLRSPTDEPTGTGNNGNDQNGIWFGSPGAPPTAALNLPKLPEGWKYEGWVVVEGVGPLTTGTFTSFNKDDNAGLASSFSGTENPGPPIPGEDFFNNAPDGFTFPLDITGKKVVVSIEPYPDNSPNPFLLKPLLGTAGNETAPTIYDLMFSNKTFPTGSVTR